MADLPHLASRLYGTPLLIARPNAIEAGESVAITRQGRRDRPAGPDAPSMAAEAFR